MHTLITLVMLVVGEVRFGELPPSKVVIPAKPVPAKPIQPQQKSDLHSHLCSKCNVEWWHDPANGAVSHNCPKCGRQQFVVNRTTPTGARPTNSTAATPQQVVRAPVTPKEVCVVGSTTCGACVAFRKKHGDGDPNGVRYRYAYMDRPKPAEFDTTAWNELVKHNNSGRFLWPFFVVKLDDGEFVAVQARVE